MICTNCGKEINDNAKFCPYCGRKIESNEVTLVQPQKAPACKPRWVKAFAIAGMVLGICSAASSVGFAASIICGIGGLVFSTIALVKGERKMPIAGIVCSCVGLFLGLIGVLIVALWRVLLVTI